MKKPLKIIALVCVMLMMFNIVAFADEAPRQAGLSERTSWNKNAEVNEKYAPRVKVMENGVRVQKTPYNTGALDTQAGDVESKTITAWNNYFLNADNRGCTACHSGVGMGGDQYQKFGLIDGPYWKFTGSKAPDDGRFEVTKSEDDKNVFRTPGLRNVARTYPYFHDGSVWSLEKAVDIMAQAQLGQKMPAADVKSIVTFLNVLTGEVPASARTMPVLPANGPDTPHPEHHK